MRTIPIKRLFTLHRSADSQWYIKIIKTNLGFLLFGCMGRCNCICRSNESVDRNSVIALLLGAHETGLPTYLSLL